MFTKSPADRFSVAVAVTVSAPIPVGRKDASSLPVASAAIILPDDPAPAEAVSASVCSGLPVLVFSFRNLSAIFCSSSYRIIAVGSINKTILLADVTMPTN